MRGARRVGFWLSYCVVLSLLGGLVTHTSFHPRILGKYSPAHAAALVTTLLIAILWKPFFRFFVTRTRVRMAHRDLIVSAKSKLLCAATVALCLFAIGEAYCRHLHPHRFLADEDERAFDPFIQNTLIPSDRARHINSLGFRGEEIGGAPDPMLIVMLGGSSVLSSRVPYTKCHSYLLQQKLRERFPATPLFVQGAGNHWHTSQHSLIKYLFQVRDHDPDVLIVWHGINDLVRSFAPPDITAPGATYERDYSHFYGPITRIVRRYFDPEPQPPLVSSLLAQSIADSLYSDFRPEPKELYADTQSTAVSHFPSLAAFRENLALLVERVQADGVTLVLATQPSLYREGLTAAEEESLWFHKYLCVADGRRPDVMSMARGMAMFNAATRDVAEAYGVPLVDLDSAVPKTGEYFLDDCHYTEAGNRRIAETIFTFLEKHDIPALDPAGD